MLPGPGPGFINGFHSYTNPDFIHFCPDPDFINHVQVRIRVRILFMSSPDPDPDFIKHVWSGSVSAIGFCQRHNSSRKAITDSNRHTERSKNKNLACLRKKK